MIDPGGPQIGHPVRSGAAALEPVPALVPATYAWSPLVLAVIYLLQ